VPDIEGATVGGDRFSLGAHAGEVVLLNYWATWCKPCRQELPELARLHRAHGADGFSVVGLNVDVARLRNKVSSMTKQMKLPFPVVLDPKNQWVPPMEVVGYPTSFLVGRDGTVRWRRDGLIEEHDEELAAAIANALAEPPPEAKG
jgi:thiol-disulfide isomerase/thioredoxin